LNTGSRSLSKAQIDVLAEAIVEQMRLRGPFVSMADFVNRRLANDETGRTGELQAVIDLTDINDNACIQKNDFSRESNRLSWAWWCTSDDCNCTMRNNILYVRQEDGHRIAVQEVH
jgi:hypothetical protein